MPEIIIVLQCLGQCLDKNSLRQLNSIVPAMLAITGQVTMLGISRWTEKGGATGQSKDFTTQASSG